MKHGSTFGYSGLSVTPTVQATGSVEVSVDVTNTGDRDGEEVVQLYVRDDVASMVRPVQELAGFRRVAIPAGSTRTVHFTVRADQFAFLDVDMQWLVEAGTMTVLVGASSADIRQEGSFRIEHSAVIDGRRRGFFATTSID